MKAVFVNYCFTPDWIRDYDFDYVIYDRSDDGKDWLKDFPSERIIKTANIGQVDYDKLNYLINNYDNLPEMFLWSKSNLFKFITPEEYEKVANNKVFTPLLTKNHKIYSDQNGVVCYYQGEWYKERNDNWFFNQFPSKYVNSFNEWAEMFQLPTLDYIPFSPGGSYILTREKVHKYSRDYYQRMAGMLPYAREPVEAQCAERSYGLMWGDI